MIIIIQENIFIFKSGKKKKKKKKEKWQRPSSQVISVIGLLK